MSPFLKNLQRFLLIFFTAIPVILITLGVMRSKSKDATITVVPNLNTAGQPVPAPSSPQQPTTPTETTATQQDSVTIAGKTFQTPYGYVSASITVANGKITRVSMPQVPNSPPSIQAEPYLVQQALAAGSANIQGVSGATYTSLAFKSSLESAIAQAKTQGQTVTPNITTKTISPKPSIPSRYRDDD